ncbi:MAG: TIGR04211 family SH3 domain-containing protein [Myxococcales bacterium]|nr:TIGR04211 family SH3 domain-containing protein [Myxococcales bacterium]
MPTPRHRATRQRARWAAILLLGGSALGIAGSAPAETAWVKDELRLNLRTGPGVQYRIVGVVKTGDAVQILDRTEGWTQIRVGSLGDGWIPEGYLQGEAPAGVRLAQSEAQTSESREQLASLKSEVERLTQQNEEIAGRDAGQRASLERLSRENFELRAGARWPEWITGAGILAAGMVLGAILHAISARRARPRLRI